MANEDRQGGGQGDAGQPGDDLKGSARQIWLAGLGALARAQEEGSKLFDSLVKEGKSLHGKLPEAQEQVGRARDRVADMAAQASDRIEGLFDDRLARALGRLDVPRGSELDALAARVEALERAVAELASAAPPRGAPRPDDGSSAPDRSD